LILSGGIFNVFGLKILWICDLYFLRIFVFYRFEDFDLPFFVCPVSFLTGNGRGENMRERERERERERWGGEMGVLERRGGKDWDKKPERREKRGMCYFRIKIMHWVATMCIGKLNPLGVG
jgi:hypothetical protein